MKNRKWMDRLRAMALRPEKGKKPHGPYGKRVIAAGTVGVLALILLGTAGVYGVTTRTMVEKTNEMVLGQDYVDWMRAQIEDVTYLTVEGYMEGEGGTIADFVNRNDINGMTEKILREIDRRYRATGEAFSAGQRDEVERIVKSEINNSIETALTALTEQNIEELTEKTYQYVAEYVTNNLEQVFRRADENDADIRDLRKKDEDHDGRLADNESVLKELTGKSEKQEKDLTAVDGKTKENEKKLGELEGQMKSGADETKNVQTKQSSDIETLSGRADAHDREMQDLRSRTDENTAEIAAFSEQTNGLITALTERIVSLESQIRDIDFYYPVGSLYISLSAQSPAELYGGTWVQVGCGRALTGAGTGTDVNGTAAEFPAGSEGGAYTHVLTVGEMPSHTHSYTDSGSFQTSWGNGHASVTGEYVVGSITRTGGGGGSVTGATGDNAPFGLLQPYFTAYIWGRVG